MWDSNDYVKLAAKVFIFINILVGLLFVGYGLYVVFLPWGDAESYQALGICLTLFGLAFTCGSIFGYLSVDYQLKRFGRCHLTKDPQLHNSIHTAFLHYFTFVIHRWWLDRALGDCIL